MIFNNTSRGEIDTSQFVNANKASIVLSGDTPFGK